MGVIIAGVVVAVVMWLLTRSGKEAGDAETVGGSAVQAGVGSGKPAGEESGRPAEKMNNNNEVTMENKEQQLGTRDLFLRTLTELGCQYEIDEDDNNRIIFGYQGERFDAYSYNDRAYVWIRDPYWMCISQEDIEDMARLRRVINDSNIRHSVTAVYTLCDDDKSFNVHSQTVLIFLSQFPKLTDYLRSELNGFFLVKQFISAELEKLRKEEGTAE